MTEENKTLWSCLCILFVLLVSPLVFIYQGWVVCELWKWFVIPQFGLQPLSIPIAIGLSYVVCLLVPTPPTPKETNGNLGQILCVAIAKPTLVWAFGWIVHLFVAR